MHQVSKDKYEVKQSSPTDWPLCATWKIVHKFLPVQLFSLHRDNLTSPILPSSFLCRKRTSGVSLGTQGMNRNDKSQVSHSICALYLLILTYIRRKQDTEAGSEEKDVETNVRLTGEKTWICLFVVFAAGREECAKFLWFYQLEFFFATTGTWGHSCLPGSKMWFWCKNTKKRKKHF